MPRTGPRSTGAVEGAGWDCRVVSTPPSLPASLWPLAKDNPKRAASVQGSGFEKVPFLQAGHLQSGLCVEFLFLNAAEAGFSAQVLQRNAFNKNLMGSGSSAESPYEFQVFVGPWLGQGLSYGLQMALSVREPTEEGPTPAEERPLFPASQEGAPPGGSMGTSGLWAQEGAKPLGPGVAEILLLTK